MQEQGKCYHSLHLTIQNKLDSFTFSDKKEKKNGVFNFLLLTLILEMLSEAKAICAETLCSHTAALNILC